jgi:hypothetical protein
VRQSRKRQFRANAHGVSEKQLHLRQFVDVVGVETAQVFDDVCRCGEVGGPEAATGTGTYAWYLP